MKKWFRNLKFRSKMQMIIICTVLIIILAEWGGQRAIYHVYDEQLYEKTVQVLVAFSGEVESGIQRIENLTFSMIADSSLQKYLQIYRDEAKNTSAWVSSRREIENRLRYFSFQGTSLKSLSLIKDHDILSNVQESSTKDKLYIEKALASKGTMTLIPEEGSLTIAREIRQIAKMDLSTLGVIVAPVDLNKLLRDCMDKFERMGIALNVSVFSDGYCLYTEPSIDTPPILVEDGWKIVNDQFIVGVTSEKLNCNFVVTSPYSEVQHVVHAAIRRSVLIVSFVTILAVFLSFKFLGNIIRELTNLIWHMDKMGTGQLPEDSDITPYLSRSDEIARLYRHFFRMARDYKKLTQEYYDSMLMLKDAQLRQLQQQIQSHFLFNTLAHITSMAYQQNNTAVAHIVQRLANMLRVTIRQSEMLVTVEEDLKMVEDYLYIQQIRYSDRLFVEINLPPECRQLKVPSITLQPIVENIISHALEEMLEPCQIRITFESDESEARIVVSDNGPGFTQAQLDLVLAQQSTGNQGIGLSNIHKRLRMVFSDKYGLSVREGCGETQVVVHIPNSVPLQIKYPLKETYL